MIVDINASVLQGSETGGYEEMELTKTKSSLQYAVPILVHFLTRVTGLIMNKVCKFVMLSLFINIL